jgi:hypothetical protein
LRGIMDWDACGMEKTVLFMPSGEVILELIMSTYD